MSLDKQGTVKSELSVDGRLKLKFKPQKLKTKRHKNVDDAGSTHWVTEARGHGIGKLVIKRKDVGSVRKSHDAANTGVHMERQTEQHPNGPIPRLSITSNTSGDGQVKCWSLCEVPPVTEDVPSVSELSPASQLQSSPKDSGIDISSPPHDDGTVNIEPNPATGIWSTAECAVDSLPIETDKATSSPEKYETTVAGFRADGAVPSGSKTVCAKAEPYSHDNNSPKVESTLRSRHERSSALRSLGKASQKLVNPLAKSHTVGRYQHMLPVNRIRAESNIARRSSLEESPTYNMLASRTSPCKPRVRTKLKLLSNNTYAPVFDQGEPANQPAVGTETIKHSITKKSPSADTSHKRNRHSCKSSKSDAFEIMKVKLCYGDNENDSVDAQGVAKLPKLKLVVKSDPTKSVSCLTQELDDAGTEQEKAPVKSTRSLREVHKSKPSGNTVSEDQIHHAVGGINASHLSSSKLEESRTRRSKHKRLEAKQVDDREPVTKKSRLQTYSPRHLANQIPDVSDLRQSSDRDRVDDTSKSGHCSAPTDDTDARDVSVSVSSVNADELSTEVSLCHESGTEQPAVQQEAESGASAVGIMPSELPAESESNSPYTSHSSTADSGIEQSLGKDSSSDSEKCAELNSSDTNADDVVCEVDQQVSRLGDNHDGEAVKDDIWTTELRKSTSGCISEHNELAVVAPVSTCNSSVPATTICSDVRPPVEDTAVDSSGESNHTHAAFENSSVSCTVGTSSTVCTDTSVMSASVDFVMQDINCTNSGSVDIGDITEVQDEDLLITSKPPADTVDSSSCGAVSTQNDACNISCVDPANTELWQNILHQSSETEASSDENSELKSLCFLPDELRNLPDECELLVNELTPSTLLSLSPVKETAAATVASSNGFLAAFTQFVQKAGTKKKPASCSVTDSDSTSTSHEKIMTPSVGSEKSVRHRPCSSRKSRRTSEKLASAKNRSPLHVSESDGTADTLSVKETCSLEAGRAAEIALKEDMLLADCSSACSEETTIITDKLFMPTASTSSYSGPGKDVSLQSADETTVPSGSSHKFVRKKHRQRRTDSEKHALSKNRARCHLSVSEIADDTVSVKEIRSPDTRSLTEIAVESEIPTAPNSASVCTSARDEVTNKPCMPSESSDNILHSAEKTVATSCFSQMSDFFSLHSRRRRRTGSEKQTASKNRLSCLPSVSEDTVETVCVKETALPETGSTALIAKTEHLLTVRQQDSTSRVAHVTADKPFVPSSSFFTDTGHDNDNTLRSALTSGCSHTSVEQTPFSPHRQQHIKLEAHTALENSLLYDLSECEKTVETDLVQEMFSLLTGNFADSVVKNARSATQQQYSSNEVAAATDKPCTLATSSLAVSGTDKDTAIPSTEKIPAKYRSSQTAIRRGPFSRAFSAHKWQHTFSEKQNSSDSKMPYHRSESECKVDAVSVTETDFVGRDRSLCTERLTCTAAVERSPLLSKDELSTTVSADRQLVALRHRLCELIETVFPELRFPPGFRRDTSSVERFVKEITDALSDGTTDTPGTRQCTDPVVTLHRMPDRCLQSLQRQIVRLLSLILPDTDLSDISVDSLDVLLELVTSLNRPAPRTLPASPADPCQEIRSRLSNTFSPHRQPLSLFTADTGIIHDSVDTVVRTDAQLSAGDAFLSIPNSLMPITSPGAACDKRSIRRQVKDCLMLLDRDLT